MRRIPEWKRNPTSRPGGLAIASRFIFRKDGKPARDGMIGGKIKPSGDTFRLGDEPGN